MDQPMVIAKLAAEVGLVAVSGMASILAASGDTAITYSAIVAFIGFTGLLVRQVVGNQRMFVGIVAAKDAQLAERQQTIDYLRWENETIRYRHGERELDPGPFTPRAPQREGANP